jgi:ssDNA-binding Zn-finger/Zn-ribbon topoisomerase 1
MSISIACVHCGRRGVVPDEYQGKKIRCPACGKSFTTKSASVRRSARLDLSPSPTVEKIQEAEVKPPAAARLPEPATPPPVLIPTPAESLDANEVVEGEVLETNEVADWPAQSSVPPTVACPNCGRTRIAPKWSQGAIVRCAGCGGQFVIDGQKKNAAQEAVNEGVYVAEPVGPEPATRNLAPPVEVVAAADRPPGWKTCPFCAEAIKHDAVKCRYCGEMLYNSPRASKGQKAAGGMFFQAIGALLLLGGLLAVIAFYNMDTTVEVPKTEILGHSIGGGRTHNLGLMQERQIGLLVSLAVTAAGFLSLIVGGVLAGIR